MKPKGTIFSGIQPSGDLHIGNYLGALKNWVCLLNDYDCIFCIVDYHAITVPYDTAELSDRIWRASLDFIASGLDPERCTIFVQSRVPAHTELAWIFNTITPLGDLERMTQFKDKSAQHRQDVNAGLLCYPILQAADILIYKANAVPVGKDQQQHVEFSRRVARHFNAAYGETFPEPECLLSEAADIRGLDGTSKMSKSRNNFISLNDSPEQIWERLRPAVTDPARVKRTDPGTPEFCNIYSLHQLFSTKEEQECVAHGCRTAGIGCIDCKKILAKNIAEALAPIRERRAELEANPDYVRQALDEGARRCKELAARTMAEVRVKMGID